jgi:hypothetical protein
VNPCVLHNCLDEDLDAALSGLISLVVLDLCGPSSFGMHVVNMRSFHVDCRAAACRSGGWAYKGSTIVVKVPVCISNESPEVVDAIGTVVGGLEKDRGDCVGETDKIVVGGLSIDGDGEEERLGCCKG